tara:strand:+ start:307 stop:525 length:219 start_codon:yes stop_codon:yes gene_type:complete
MIQLAQFALTRDDKDGGTNVYVNVMEIESVKEIHISRAVLYMKSGEVIRVEEKVQDVLVKILEGSGKGSTLF